MDQAIKEAREREIKEQCRTESHAWAQEQMYTRAPTVPLSPPPDEPSHFIAFRPRASSETMCGPAGAGSSLPSMKMEQEFSWQVPILVLSPSSWSTTRRIWTWMGSSGNCVLAAACVTSLSRNPSPDASFPLPLPSFASLLGDKNGTDLTHGNLESNSPSAPDQACGPQGPHLHWKRLLFPENRRAQRSDFPATLSPGMFCVCLFRWFCFVLGLNPGPSH